MEIIGWIGGILLATCGFPQVIKVLRERHADGMSDLNVLLWFIGEVFMLIYVLFVQFSLLLFLSYALNFVFVLVIMYYKYFYKASQHNR